MHAGIECGVPDMSTYELCLLDHSGKTKLSYQLLCLNDERALAEVRSLSAIDYARFEIWKGMRLVNAGIRYAVN
jgi:hypothetical protein